MYHTISHNLQAKKLFYSKHSQIIVVHNYLFVWKLADDIIMLVGENLMELEDTTEEYGEATTSRRVEVKDKRERHIVH